MVTFRAMVASADERLRRAATEAAENLRCEVFWSEEDDDCLGGVCAARPDLLILVPPLSCGSVTDVLAALRQEPAARRVSVLVLGDLVRSGPFPRVLRLFLCTQPGQADMLPRLVDRLHARSLGGWFPAGCRAILQTAEL